MDKKSITEFYIELVKQRGSSPELPPPQPEPPRWLWMIPGVIAGLAIGIAITSLLLRL